MKKQQRREFIKTAASAGLGFWVAGEIRAAEKKSANEEIRFGCIGIGGKGEGDTADAARSGKVVAICDIDDQRLAKAAQKYPAAKKFNDFRQMFDEMGKSIDAVTVSTPDHTHAVAAALAMNLGKHCFTQKPLTHSIHEARKLGEIARKMKVATQMGNQGTASGGLRKGAALIRAGVLGTVKEVHVWTNRPIWPQGGPLPAPAPIPPHVHWDLWLGPMADRPYANGYHPFSWRGWWDFGTGALGDMACHTMNLPFMALDLRDPIAVEATSSGHNKISYPKWSIIKYSFPARDQRPALTLTWYDGGKLPPAELINGEKMEHSGSLIIGEKGKLYSPGDNGTGYKLLGGVEEVKVEVKNSPGHFQEFVRAAKGGEPATSNFPDYAGPLTETVLLGNLAVWAGRKIEWNAKNLTATNAPEVEPIIKPNYRQGWSL
jgi:predicted dehydrogenase